MCGLDKNDHDLLVSTIFVLQLDDIRRAQMGLAIAICLSARRRDRAVRTLRGLKGHGV